LWVLEGTEVPRTTDTTQTDSATVASDEGVYIIVARPEAIGYGRTFTVNGRAFTFRHLVSCVTFGADFGRLQPAKQQCGCHGLKRRPRRELRWHLGEPCTVLRHSSDQTNLKGVLVGPCRAPASHTRAESFNTNFRHAQESKRRGDCQALLTFHRGAVESMMIPCTKKHSGGVHSAAAARAAKARFEQM
jgi:hypothetical protein